MTMLGHLGTKVSDLLDDRLCDRDSAAAWAHVDGCATCQELVETEAWVKNTLSGLGSSPTCASANLKDRLASGPLLASYAEATPAWSLPEPDDHRRNRWTLAALGGGAAGAAVLGIVAMGVVPSQAPVTDRRSPVTSIRQVADQLRQAPTGTATSRSAPGHLESVGARTEGTTSDHDQPE